MPRRSISVLRLTANYITEIQECMDELWGASFSRIKVVDYCVEQLRRKYAAGEVSYPVIKNKMKALRAGDKIILGISDVARKKLDKLSIEYRKYGITDSFMLSVIIYVVATEMRAALIRFR